MCRRHKAISQYKPICRQISTLEISLAIPHHTYGSRQEGSNAISDLAEYGFEEEAYPIVDYELVI